MYDQIFAFLSIEHFLEGVSCPCFFRWAFRSRVIPMGDAHRSGISPLQGLYMGCNKFKGPSHDTSPEGAKSHSIGHRPMTTNIIITRVGNAILITQNKNNPCKTRVVLNNLSVLAIVNCRLITKVSLEELAAAGGAQLGDGFVFYLAHTLAGEGEFLAYILQAHGVGYTYSEI